MVPEIRYTFFFKLVGNKGCVYVTASIHLSNGITYIVDGDGDRDRDQT